MNNQKNTDENFDVNKRNFIKTMSGLAAVGVVSSWIPTQQAEAWFFSPSERLPNFPSDIRAVKKTYENWSGESRYEDAWTIIPTNQAQVVRAVNWAAENGYKVRPRGNSHNWSPIMLDDQDKVTKIILIDMVTHINKVNVDVNGIVTAEAGVQMETLLDKMENAGRGFIATPAPGDITLGGVLAIDGHGTAIPAIGETKQYAQTYGSISNLIVSLTALVYNENSRKYEPKTFNRNDPEISAFMVHVGKAFILSAQLQTSKNHYLRCESFTDIHQKELFSQNKDAGKTFASFLDEAGRIEAIWYPFTDYPWVKVWTITERRPLTAKIVSKPFNYLFSDNLVKPITDLIHEIVVNNNTAVTPTFGKTQLSITKMGLQGSPTSGFATIVTGGLVSLQGYDLWGPSKDLLLYIKPTTLRVTANGYAVITSRENVQKVIADFCETYTSYMEKYQKLNRFPMNGPVEIRVTGLDDPKDSIVKGAQTAALSAIKPCPDHPEWDCAVWFDILTLPGTPYAAEFYNEIETWICQRYQGDSLVRPEWSKGWGYSREKAWDNTAYFQHELQHVHEKGQPHHLTIASAAKILKRYDSLNLFTAPILEKIFGQ
jgi:FAD/FMN-containing dehydrogenase